MAREIIETKYLCEHKYSYNFCDKPVVKSENYKIENENIDKYCIKHLQELCKEHKWEFSHKSVCIDWGGDDYSDSYDLTEIYKCIKCDKRDGRYLIGIDLTMLEEYFDDNPEEFINLVNKINGDRDE
ncbi:hypothetical protein [Spiroplasma endosymbiont of Labia minor]|uniref:hypothetical protein n=1 Tax=Spiroplasma endosymbiont of Labia minor TaxID=3066305 RepID=UPI0030CFD3A4